MEVRFFNRKKNNIFFSIEDLFASIQKVLSDSISIQNKDMPNKSIGIISWAKNILFSLKNKGEINHITGDVHYLGIFLPRNNTVLTIHDCGELDKQRGLKKFFLWLFWFYLPVKRLKYITVISQATKVHLLKYVNTNSSKIIVIPNCLIGNYSFNSKDFNAKKPVILQVGVTPNKNIERVAAALENIPCILRIIGRPSKTQIEAFEKHKIEYEYVTDLSRQEIIEEYDNCDFVIFVSLLEGFGLPIIEAQASGKAVITSNIEPMCATAGEGACLVDPYSKEDIRQGILNVINNENYRVALIQNGEKNYKRFSPAVVADVYLQLYKKIYEYNSL
ncbi:MAG: glycosyltransferase family 4 protein [Chitinophagaceae bacterium]|nr:glycosyltransferase family 4 protein [Chitinophagaceae bacterium]